MNPILHRTWKRARLLAARSEFPDADPRLFLGDAFRDVIRGVDEEQVRSTACVDACFEGAWSAAQHCAAGGAK